jgi:hypothetical protein
MRRFPAKKEDEGILTVAAQQSNQFLLSSLIDKRYQRLMQHVNALGDRATNGIPFATKERSS